MPLAQGRGCEQSMCYQPTAAEKADLSLKNQTNSHKEGNSLNPYVNG